MTKIFNDNIQVTLKIDGNDWLLIDAKVELSRMDTPNYVDLLMTPSSDAASSLPDDVEQLIGAPFRLEADNSLISERVSDADKDSLLFAGELANISPTGEKTFEAIAYDPAQQAFAPNEKGGGSIMNQTIGIGKPEYSHNDMWAESTGTQYETNTIKAIELAQRIVDTLNISDYRIQFGSKEIGIIRDGPFDSYEGAYDRDLSLFDNYITVADALNKLRESCEVEWWFDKEGQFNMGVPEPTKHELKFITDASAGKTTPPYQSVRVIGSGAASSEGYERDNMNIEDKIVVEATIALNEKGAAIPNYGETKEPIFEYKNLELSTDAQARSAAKRLIEDLSEQQSDGTVTVAGFPEIVPMDGIVMPAGENGDYPEGDIRLDQPMGGMGYGVYKVVHRLNSSDGFITKIHVSSVTGVTATQVAPKQASTSYEIVREEEDVNSQADFSKLARQET